MISTVFFGTDKTAAHILQGIQGEGFEVVLAVTRPPSKSGRGRVFKKTSVHKLCEFEGIKCLQPRKPEKEEIAYYIEMSRAQIAIIASYGLFIPSELISICKIPFVNYHPSMIPLYRGAAPAARAIMNGESQTGVTLMEVTEEMDAGDIIAQEKDVIYEHEDCGELEARLADLGIRLIRETIPSFLEGSVGKKPQDSSYATYALPIRKEELEIDWSGNAAEIRNKIRGLSPKYGAYTIFRGKRLKIWKALATEEAMGSKPGELSLKGKEGIIARASSGGIELLEVQPEGKARMNTAAFRSGYRPQSGELFGA